jgi:NAD(P)-dependent dehydrogenase (short-subunit alcohol dehydrogenase family)
MGDRLKDKVALVSGAGSSGPGWGNGKATAVLFAREGAKVLAVDINRDAALETKRIIDGEGGICEAVSADVSRADDVSPWSAPVSRHSGGSMCCTTMSGSSRSAGPWRPPRRAGIG